MAITQRWTFPNGLTVIAQQSPGIPLACANFFIRSGSAFEKPEEAGLAHLTAELLLQGTSKRSARQIADEIESLGSSLGAQSAEDSTELAFVTREENLSNVWNVAMDVLLHPSFPNDEIQKERKQTLASLKSRQDTIFSFAYDHFNTALFGTHPYGRPAEGTLQTVQHFNRSAIQKWYQIYFRPDRTTLSFSSGLPLSKVRALIERSLAHWKPHSQAAPVALCSMAGAFSGEKLTFRSRFEQAYLMTGMRAPAAFQPGFVALKVLNTLLGGGMSSRLFTKLREESGLAYEVSSFYPTHKELSQWTMYLGLPADKLNAAQSLLESILADLEKNGPTAQELVQAKQMIRGAFLMEHQTRRRRAWSAGWWEFLGRGYAYDADYLNEIEAVTSDEIHHWIRFLLSQPRLTVKVLPKKQ